jgi:hypothetical protein
MGRFCPAADACVVRRAREIAVGRGVTKQRFARLVENALRLVVLAAFDLALQGHEQGAEQQRDDEQHHRHLDERKAAMAPAKIRGC